ncbi:MAG: O-antigen/teichoic acid export membrane protein, partial [Arcticibacterium sp.]
MKLDFTRTQTTRLAGFLYLLLIIFGVFSLMYVPGQIMDWDSADKTLENLRNHELLFKLSIVSGLIMALVFLILAYVLYKLLSEANVNLARVLLIFCCHQCW